MSVRLCGLELRRAPKLIEESTGVRHHPFDGTGAHQCFTHLEDFSASVRAIPGMLSEESGRLLFTLCAMQTMEGVVVEVGSWQGYSTAFLAAAVRDSGNGRVIAIDHFRGNVGKEDLYAIGDPQLSDLKAGFLTNLRRAGLDAYVQLLDMPNTEAVQHLGEEPIRFLFIDGDHTREGVQRDIDLFIPRLKPGSIAVFDDFAPHATGLVEAIDGLLASSQPQRVFAYANTLVIML